MSSPTEEKKEESVRRMDLDKGLLSNDDTTADTIDDEKEKSIFEQIKAVFQYSRYRSIILLIMFYSTAGLIPAVFMSAYGAEWFSTKECDAMTDSDCKYDYEKWTFYNSLFLSIRGAISFLFSGFIGRLSDTFGRKPFFYVALVTSALPFVPLVFFYNLWPYFIFNAICGLNGSGNSFTPIMIAYVSDIIPEKHRTVAFGLMYLFGGIGLFIGSLCSIIVSLIWSDYINFFVILGIYFCLLLYTFQYIQESVSAQIKKEITKFNPFRSLAHVRDHPIVFNAAIIAFMISLPETGVIDTAIPYMLDQMEANDDKAQANMITGTFIIVTGLGIVLVNLLMLPALKKRFNDYEITIIGAILVSISMFMFAVISWIPHIAIVCLCGINLSMGFIVFPSLYSIVTSSLSKKEQGLGMGIIFASRGLTYAIAPFSFGYSYTLFKSVGLPSFPYIIATLICSMSLFVIVYSLKPVLDKIKNDPSLVLQLSMTDLSTTMNVSNRNENSI